MLVCNFKCNFDTFVTGPPIISQWQGIRITCRSIPTGFGGGFVIGIIRGPLHTLICIKIINIKQFAGVYNHLCRLHLGVAVGCYYCSGNWWTSKGWSDNHTSEHPWSDPYPSGAVLERLLVKKAQAPTVVDSKAAFTTPFPDNFLGEETQSSTSIEDDKEDDVPPLLSSSLHNIPSAAPIAKPSLEGFGGARPHVSTAAMGSGHHKKALPHHSTHA